MLLGGANLLNMAMGLIGGQTVSYLRNTGRTLNAAGFDVATYAAPVQVSGNLQPMSRTLMQVQGLDMNKNYVNFYTPRGIIDVSRGNSGDQIKYQGKTYQCLNITDWLDQNGWVAVQCVEIVGHG